MAAKNKWNWSTGSDLLPAGLPASFDFYKKQESGEAENCFEVTPAAKKGPFNSYSSFDSDFATSFVPQNITRERRGSFSVSVETSAAALLHASKPYFRPHNCRRSDLVHASSFDASASVLDGTL